MRCEAGTAPHRNLPILPQMQQFETAGAKSKLDKSWEEGRQTCKIRFKINLADSKPFDAAVVIALLCNVNFVPKVNK